MNIIKRLINVYIDFLNYGLKYPLPKLIIKNKKIKDI